MLFSAAGFQAHDLFMLETRDLSMLFIDAGSQAHDVSMLSSVKGF